MNSPHTLRHGSKEAGHFRNADEAMQRLISHGFKREVNPQTGQPYERKFFSKVKVGPEQRLIVIEVVPLSQPGPLAELDLN